MQAKTEYPLPITRLRRLRRSQGLRNLIRDTVLSVNDLVLPLFIRHGKDISKPINSMPGHSQISIDKLPEQIAELRRLKIPAVMLFGIPAHKDAQGSAALTAEGVIQQAVITIKELAPELIVITDCCFCEYTDHGHCGIVNDKSGQLDVDNDATLELLVKQAQSYAQAGADIIAPSGMMDGMVAAIRHGLDQASFTHLPILSYAVKYASGLYGPFREAAEGTPQFGDRKTYQMDPGNHFEALREVELDLAEGADMVMVKPAIAYLDIITKIKTTYPEVPMAAYQVSGEYAMIVAAAERGWLDRQAVVLESFTAIKRAGANFVITYFAKEIASWLQQA